MEEKLKQIRHIDSEIETIQKQIDRIEPMTCIDKVSGSSCVFPYTERSFQIAGVDVDDYNRRTARLKSRLIKKKDELLKLKEEVQSFIDGIEDSFIRQIITLRYMNGEAWTQIAKEVSGNNTPDGIRMMAKRFLKNI